MALPAQSRDLIPHVGFWGMPLVSKATSFYNNVEREDCTLLGVAESVVESLLLASSFPFLKEGFAYGIRRLEQMVSAVFGLISEFRNNYDWSSRPGALIVLGAVEQGARREVFNHEDLLPCAVHINWKSLRLYS